MKKLWCIMLLTFSMATFSTTAEAQATVKQKTRTGWSKKAKNTVIGAGVGAATGAAVSKDKSKGAIIGGAVGAGAGYAYGRHRDKKYPARKKVVKVKKTTN